MKAKAIFLNKRILLSLGMLFVIGALIATATGAFYNDVETSTGNTFTAGEIDLKIDNHAWYNGIECKFHPGSEDSDRPEGWYWADDEGNAQGDSYLESLIGQRCQSSWELKDLESGDLFFNFDDLKAGDWEEDTISLHVTNNDAWVCVDMELTSDDDVNTVEPELEAGDTEDDDTDNWDGELGEALHFIFWADDGDNVLEIGEEIVASGTPAEELPSGDDNGGRSFPIVDSTTNLFGEAGEPFVPGTTWYIGKAFCYGDIVPNPVAQGDNSPAINPGFSCDGSTVSNQTQTDSLVGNISFTAVQSRNNGDFVCARQDDGGEERQITGTASDGWASVAGSFSEAWQADGRFGDGGASPAEHEVRIGLPGGGSPLAEEHSDNTTGPWRSGVAESFTLTYDGAGNATLMIGDVLVDTSSTVNAGNVPANGNNVLGITLKTKTDLQTVELTDVKIDGLTPSGDTGVTATGVNVKKNILLTGDVELSDGFTVTGTVEMTWSDSPGAEDMGILFQLPTV